MKNMSELNQWNQCKDKKDNNVIGRLIADAVYKTE